MVDTGEALQLEEVLLLAAELTVTTLLRACNTWLKVGFGLQPESTRTLMVLPFQHVAEALDKILSMVNRKCNEMKHVAEVWLGLRLGNGTMSAGNSVEFV